MVRNRMALTHEEAQATENSRTIEGFDQALVCALHTWTNYKDYYAACDLHALLKEGLMTVPVTCIASQNDPVIPFATQPHEAAQLHPKLIRVLSSEGDRKPCMTNIYLRI